MAHSHAPVPPRTYIRANSDVARDTTIGLTYVTRAVRAHMGRKESPFTLPRTLAVNLDPTPWLGSVRLRACGAGFCGAASAETSILFYSIL